MVNVHRRVAKSAESDYFFICCPSCPPGFLEDQQQMENPGYPQRTIVMGLWERLAAAIDLTRG